MGGMNALHHRLLSVFQFEGGIAGKIGDKVKINDEHQLNDIMPKIYFFEPRIYLQTLGKVENLLLFVLGPTKASKGVFKFQDWVLPVLSHRH